MRCVILGAVGALLLSGCNSTRSAPPASAPFDPAEAAFIKKEGGGTIQGQAFLRDAQGQSNVRYAAGEIIRLIPATAYARARFSHFYGDRKFVSASAIPSVSPDPEYAAYTRTTKAGATGRFVFDKLAPGHYFVTTQITWKPKDSFVTEGGAVYDEATVTGKETEPVEVVLSGK